MICYKTRYIAKEATYIWNQLGFSIEKLQRHVNYGELTWIFNRIHKLSTTFMAEHKFRWWTTSHIFVLADFWKSLNRGSAYYELINLQFAFLHFVYIALYTCAFFVLPKRILHCSPFRIMAPDKIKVLFTGATGYM